MVKSCRSAHRACPHRLEDQDVALSRLKLEFESPWGHYYIRVFASPSLLSGRDEIAGHPFLLHD